MNAAISSTPAYIPTQQPDVRKAAAGFGAQPLQAGQIEQVTQAMLQQMLQSTLSPGSGSGSPLPLNRPQLRQPSITSDGNPSHGQTSVAAGAVTGEAAVGSAATEAPVANAKVEVRAFQGGADVGKLTPEAALTQLVGDLTATLQSSNVADLTARLEQYKAMNASVRADADRLAGTFNQAQSELTQALANANSAAEASKPVVAQAAQARTEADTLKAKLDALSPQDAGYAAAEQAYQTSLATADRLGQQAQQLLAPLTALNEKVVAASDALEAVENEIDKLPVPQPALAAQVRQATLTNAAVFSQLMATLGEVVAHASQAKVESNSDFAIKQLRASQKENTRKSEEYQKQIEKAEALQSGMKCAGKILGWLVTVVSVIAAPFSGGASLALAAVGLALAITSEVTGFSLIGKALEPFTKHVLEPLIKELGKAFAEMLEKAGMSPDEAKRVGSILGAVFGAVVIVVVAVVAVVLGKAAGSAVIKSITPALTRAFKDVVPAVIKQVARQAGQMGARLNSAVAKTLGTSVEKVTARVAIAHTANTALQVTGDVVKGAGDVARASGEVDAAKTLAALNNNLANNKAIQALMKSLAEDFEASGDFLVQAYALIAQTMQGQTSTGKAILRAAKAA